MLRWGLGVSCRDERRVSHRASRERGEERGVRVTVREASPARRTGHGPRPIPDSGRGVHVRRSLPRCGPRPDARSVLGVATDPLSGTAHGPRPSRRGGQALDGPRCRYAPARGSRAHLPLLRGRVHRGRRHPALVRSHLVALGRARRLRDPVVRTLSAWMCVWMCASVDRGTPGRAAYGLNGRVSELVMCALEWERDVPGVSVPGSGRASAYAAALGDGAEYVLMELGGQRKISSWRPPVALPRASHRRRVRPQDQASW